MQFEVIVVKRDGENKIFVEIDGADQASIAGFVDAQQTRGGATPVDGSVSSFTIEADSMGDVIECGRVNPPSSDDEDDEDGEDE